MVSGTGLCCSELHTHSTAESMPLLLAAVQHVEHWKHGSALPCAMPP
jgi:hypothetical protein